MIYAEHMKEAIIDTNPARFHDFDFDKAMLEVIGKEKNIQKSPVVEIWHNDGDQVLAYSRNDLIFVFNFSFNRSFTDYGFMVPEGAYDIILNTILLCSIFGCGPIPFFQ